MLPIKPEAYWNDVVMLVLNTAIIFLVLRSQNSMETSYTKFNFFIVFYHYVFCFRFSLKFCGLEKGSIDTPMKVPIG